MEIIIAGYDPAMANHGLVKGKLDLVTGEFTSVELLLIETASSKIKTIRKNSDDLERARKAYKGLTEFLSDVSVVCVEIPVGSQSARAMASYGICIGLVASINVPLIQVTAKDVKLALSGSANASKVTMIHNAIEECPELPWFSHKGKKGIKVDGVMYTAKNEHLADALGAIYAGVQTDEFKAVMQIMKKVNNP